MLSKITEQQLIRLLQEAEIPKQIIDRFIIDFELGMQGDSDKLVNIAQFFHEANYFSEAFYFYRLAERLQHSEAIYMLGNYAYEGLVIEFDEQAAFSHYERAANLGHKDAMNNLADMYLNGEAVTRNEKQAIKWFERAAKEGVLEAMFTLGMIYEQGLGVEVDNQKAFTYYESAALGGDPEALLRMGTIYLAPLLGLEKDESRALYYFEQAAEHDQLDAIYNLGYMYECGIGTPINSQRAIMFYKRGASLKDEASIYALSRIYLEGKIVMKDEVTARRWKKMLEQLDYV